MHQSRNFKIINNNFLKKYLPGEESLCPVEVLDGVPGTRGEAGPPGPRLWRQVHSEPRQRHELYVGIYCSVFALQFMCLKFKT